MPKVRPFFSSLANLREIIAFDIKLITGKGLS